MRIRLLLLVFYSLNFCLVGFGQRLTTSVVSEKYYPDEGWLIAETSTYDYENQEITRETYQKFYWEDGVRTKIIDRVETYHNGRIQKLVSFKSGPNSFSDRIFDIDYFYEDELIVKELIKTTYIVDTIQHSFNSEIIYFYNENQQLIREEEVFLAIDSAELLSVATYQYNNNGCLIEQFEKDFSFNREEKHIYERSSDCSILSEAIYETDINNFFNPGLREASKVSYATQMNGNHLIEIDTLFEPYFQNITGDFVEWKLSEIIEKEYNENGNLVREKVDNENTVPTIKLFEFDEKNRILEEQLYTDFGSGIFDLFSITNFVYTDVLDENEFLIKATTDKTIVHENGEVNTSFIQHFNNYCDGSVQTERRTSSENFNNLRTTYEYLHGFDCDFEKEQLPLQVFPNPSNGIFQIKGDLLQGTSTKVQVLNFVGQLIYEIRIPEQTALYELDLSHLNNGNYVIFVQNGDYFSSEKVTIFK